MKIKKFQNPASKLRTLNGIINKQPLSAQENTKLASSIKKLIYETNHSQNIIGQNLFKLKFSVNDIEKWIKSDSAKKFTNIEGLDYNLLQKNWDSFKNKLVTNDTYSKALSPRKILLELPSMATPEINLDNDDVAQRLEEFYRFDAAQRIRKAALDSDSRGFQPMLGDISTVYSKPFNDLDLRIGYTPKGWAAYSQGPNKNVFSNRRPLFSSDRAHELHHSIRFRIGTIRSDWDYLEPSFFKYDPIKNEAVPRYESLTSTNNQRLNEQVQIPGYFETELKKMEPLGMAEKFRGDKTPDAEVGAVLSEDRFKYWTDLYNKTGIRPTIEQLNSYIDLMNPVDVGKHIKTELPYGDAIGSQLEQDMFGKWYQKPFKPFKMNTYYKKLGEYWKDSLKYIGASTGIGIGFNINKNDN